MNIQEYSVALGTSLERKKTTSAVAREIGIIKCVFFSFILMQFIMKTFRLKSTEDAIRKAQALKNIYGFHESDRQISLLADYA